MKTFLFLTVTFFFCSHQLFSQVPKKPLVAKPVTQAPVAQKITTNVPNAAIVHLQKADINIVVGDDGKDKDTRLSITININGQNGNVACAYYGDGAPNAPAKSDAYSAGENVIIPTNLYAGIIDKATGPKVPGDNSLGSLSVREAVFSDFSNGGNVQLGFLTTSDILKIKSLTVSLFFDNDPVTPYKISWTNIQLSQEVPYTYLQFDKHFNPLEPPAKNMKRKTNL